MHDKGTVTLTKNHRTNSWKVKAVSGGWYFECVGVEFPAGTKLTGKHKVNVEMKSGAKFDGVELTFDASGNSTSFKCAKVGEDEAVKSASVCIQ
jgi:hypothetical protein